MLNLKSCRSPFDIDIIISCCVVVSESSTACCELNDQTCTCDFWTGFEEFEMYTCVFTVLT